jgi:HNH endonuclease
MPSRRYSSLGRCVFCTKLFAKHELGEEHIIPRAISGGLIIDHATCEQCQRRSNEGYEQPALKNDLLVPRILLQLNRRKDKRKPPPRLPRVTFDSTKPYEIELDYSAYPKLITLLRFVPAGKLAGVERGSDLTVLALQMFCLSSLLWQGRAVNTRESFVNGALALTLAKIAYCYAVAELNGFDAFDGDEIRGLLAGERLDYYNFVGGLSEPESFSDEHLHSLYFRKRGGLLTVVVHLFASCKIEPYEVVVGLDRRQAADR